MICSAKLEGRCDGSNNVIHYPQTLKICEPCEEVLKEKERDKALKEFEGILIAFMKLCRDGYATPPFSPTTSPKGVRSNGWTRSSESGQMMGTPAASSEDLEFDDLQLPAEPLSGCPVHW